jgi:ribosome-associated translation inhibitor RaiA
MREDSEVVVAFDTASSSIWSQLRKVAAKLRSGFSGNCQYAGGDRADD